MGDEHLATLTQNPTRLGTNSLSAQRLDTYNKMYLGTYYITMYLKFYIKSKNVCVHKLYMTYLGTIKLTITFLYM